MSSKHIPKGVAESIPGLRQRAPSVIAHFPPLHEIVDHAAASLRAAPSALGHGDINMWNTMVSEDRVTLIDWDLPVVCDPAMEVALLDKHTWLFNGRGFNPAFFEGYGKPPTEPNTTLHRVVQTVSWGGSADWEEFEQLDLPAEQIARTRRWFHALMKYSEDLPSHIKRLKQIT